MPASEIHFLGEWRQVAPDPHPESIFITFETAGQLRYSVEGETVQHILLTWRIEGDVLVTDQPSALRPKQTKFRFVTPSRLILERADERYAYERVMT